MRVQLTVTDALMPYQAAGVVRFANALLPLHRYMAWEPGLGKTATAIALADREGHDRVLVICPAHARLNWQREVLRWQKRPRPVQIVATSNTNKVLAGPGVVVVSYDMISREGAAIRGVLMSQQWDTLVLDEAHTLNAPTSNRTKYAFAPAKGLYRNAKRVLPLSGTPASKHAAELYPILRALFPAATDGMNYDDFVDRYCTFRTLLVNGRHVKQITGTRRDRIEELRAKIAPFLDVLKADDVLTDLPALRVENYPLSMSDLPNAKSVLGADAAIKHAITDETDILSFVNKHVTAFATERRVLGTAKSKPIADILASELEQSDRKILIFGIHRDALAVFAKELHKFGVVTIDGSCDAKAKTAAQDKFQQDPNVRVAVCQIKAASTNLTLTAASEVVLAEPSWNPLDNYQAIRRARRIGQTRPVRARFMSLEGVDERINEVLKERTEQMSQLLGTGTDDVSET